MESCMIGLIDSLLLQVQNQIGATLKHQSHVSAALTLKCLRVGYMRLKFKRIPLIQ